MIFSEKNQAKGDADKSYWRERSILFFRDATAAMMVSLNKGTKVMLMSPINSPGIELYSCAKGFFYFSLETCSLIT